MSNEYLKTLSVDEFKEYVNEVLHNRTEQENDELLYDIFTSDVPGLYDIYMNCYREV